MDPVIATLVTEVIKETESAWDAMMNLDTAVNELKREMSRLQCRNATRATAPPVKKKKVVTKKKPVAVAREDTAQFLSPGPTPPSPPAPTTTTAYPVVPPFDPTNWFPQKDAPRALPEPGC